LPFFPPWDEIEVGDTVTFYRSFTEEDVDSFIRLTIDLNPFHIDADSAYSCGFEGRVVPGLLTGSMIAHAGGTLLSEPCLGARANFNFLAPVYTGETICAQVSIVKIDHPRYRLTMKIICTNTGGDVVLEGEVSGRIIPVSVI